MWYTAFIPQMTLALKQWPWLSNRSTMSMKINWMQNTKFTIQVYIYYRKKTYIHIQRPVLSQTYIDRLHKQEWKYKYSTHEYDSRGPTILTFYQKFWMVRTNQWCRGSRISQSGAPTPVGCVQTYYLAIFLLKTAWKWKKLNWGGPLGPLLRGLMPGCRLLHTNFLCHHHLRVQKIQFFKTASRGWMSSPLMVVPTTQATFIFKQKHHS